MKRITIAVKPNAKQERVEVCEDGTLRVHVNAPAREGKANDRARELLAEHLGVPKTALKLVLGVHSKAKVFRVDD